MLLKENTWLYCLSIFVAVAADSAVDVIVIHWPVMIGSLGFKKLFRILSIWCWFFFPRTTDNVLLSWNGTKRWNWEREITHTHMRYHRFVRRFWGKKQQHNLKWKPVTYLIRMISHMCECIVVSMSMSVAVSVLFANANIPNYPVSRTFYLSFLFHLVIHIIRFILDNTM